MQNKTAVIHITKSLTRNAMIDKVHETAQFNYHAITAIKEIDG